MRESEFPWTDGLDGSGVRRNGNRLPPELPPLFGHQPGATANKVECENPAAEEIETQKATGFDSQREIVGSDQEVRLSAFQCCQGRNANLWYGRNARCGADARAPHRSGQIVTQCSKDGCWKNCLRRTRINRAPQILSPTWTSQRYFDSDRTSRGVELHTHSQATPDSDSSIPKPLAQSLPVYQLAVRLIVGSSHSPINR